MADGVPQRLEADQTPDFTRGHQNVDENQHEKTQVDQFQYTGTSRIERGSITKQDIVNRQEALNSYLGRSATSRVSDVNHSCIDYSNLGARHNDNTHYTTPIKGCSERQQLLEKIKTPPYVRQKLDSSSTHYFTDRQSNDVPLIESSMGGPGGTHMYGSSIQSRGANGASVLTQPVLGPATNSLQQYPSQEYYCLNASRDCALPGPSVCARHSTETARKSPETQQLRSQSYCGPGSSCQYEQQKSYYENGVMQRQPANTDGTTYTNRVPYSASKFRVNEPECNNFKHPPAPQPGFSVTTEITQQNVPIVQSIPSPGLYANLGVLFGGSISTHETGLSFCGKDAADYPAYRHRFIVHYNELRHTRPDLLLRWVENTVEGQAKSYIRNAFAVFDPGQACDII